MARVCKKTSVSMSNLISAIIFLLVANISSAQNNTDEIKLLLKNGNYKKAEGLINNSIESNLNNPEILFYRGIMETNLGKTNQAIDTFDSIKKNSNISFDIKDFNLNFVRGLSLEDGLSTLIDFTASTIYDSIINENNYFKNKNLKILICGGGRKNLSLVNAIKKKLPKEINLYLIDDYKIDGDFVESQAFAYLAIRSFLKKPISFPKTTNVKKPCVGGILSKNY